MEPSIALKRAVRSALACPASAHLKNAQMYMHKQQTRIPQTRIRSFTTTQHRRADNPSASNRKSRENNTTATNSQSTPTRPRPNPEDRIDLSSLPGISSSYKPPASAAATTARPTSTNSESASAKLDALFARAPTRPPSARENPFEKAIRQTDAINGTSPLSLNKSKIPSSSSSSTQEDYSILDVSALLANLDFRSDNSGSSSSIFSSSSSKTNSRSSSNNSAKLPLRLRPSLGRTVPVDPQRGMDVGRAFRTLDMKCNANGVRRDLMAQKFHVRRGQLRKLKASARWRVQFRAGFLEECGRVRRMKNQGW